MDKRIRFCRCLAVLCLALCLCASHVSSAFAYASTTLYNGSRGEAVRELQQALITLGYLKGSADGIFGNNTENAVRQFQKKNKMTVDGLAGLTTRNLIQSKAQALTSSASSSSSSASSSASSASSSSASSASASSAASSSSSGSAETSSLFGTYAAIRAGDRGDRVKTLQQALITLGFLGGRPDGIFGNQTKKAVVSFQRSKKLTADGIAGKKTLSAVQSALSAGSAASSSASSSSSSAASSQSAAASTASSAEAGDLNPKIAAPSGVQLLHWFNDVKPSISNGQHLLVYEPSSGLSWTLRILSRGRHCDAEPLTAQDTRTMVAAFGGVNTWNQKAVLVKLPDGRWSLASTHDMPHDSGSVKNNNFNGHLCVHFLRDMEEAMQNDPSYGVANQKTIRTKWKQMTGEDVP